MTNTFQELRLQQGAGREDIEEIRLTQYRDPSQEYDAMLTFVRYDGSTGDERETGRFAVSKTDAQLMITHLKIYFNL